jgi:YidC/Oxa1 family membrane protein insertase
MDKRFFLALVLTAIVIVATPLLFPGAGRRPVAPGVPSTTADSLRRAIPVDSGAPQGAQTAPGIQTPQTARAPSLPSNSSVSVPIVAVDTTEVQAKRSTYAFTSRGAVPISVVLDSYPSRSPSLKGRRVELVRPHTTLARYQLALGRDTIALDTVALRATYHDTSGAPTLTYTGDVAGHAVRIGYAFVPDSFLVRVTTSVANAPAGSALLVNLPRTLLSNEPDTLDDIGHLAVSYRKRSEVKSVAFSKLDTAEARVETGPLDWVATRNKYFLVAYRATPKQPFSSLQMRGGPRADKVAAQALATASQPLSAEGNAAFDIYAGPQDFERLQRLGADLDQVNPYGGWFQGVVQPFATIVMKALLWMKRTTHLNYGWVLVLFGVLIRLALWPLNQGAMRTSMKMQRLQPELQAIQKKYADDPKRQQEAIMKVYKDHGMSPLSPLMGCLPMLLPMPILLALYFVFQNTIEFRGVSFLWLPDISLKDPFYITPVLMGVSMFVMSWIGMKGSPPNPQAKMMTYMMPVMLTVFFLSLASGLNLYYAVQNIAALPQQWLLARERSRTGQAPVATVSGPSPAVKRRS